MKKSSLLILSSLLLLLITTLPSCSDTVDSYLILSDVQGTTAFKENSPMARVINLRAKAMIKAGNIIAAQKKALEVASNQAVDQVVREVTTAEQYNRNYKKIDTYFKKNSSNYIIAKQVTGTRKIYKDRFLGIYASFKVNRQKIIVTLQKDLHILDTSMNTIIAVVTSKDETTLKKYGIKLADIENAMLNQAQTDLNQRGLVAIDFRNAITAMSQNEALKTKFSTLSKQQFLGLVDADKTGQINKQAKAANNYYSQGLTLLQQLAKVVIEINIMSVSKTKQTMALNLSVTAKNISTATGGAFANTVIQVARKGTDSSDDTAMITSLIRDSYSEMKKEFIPQVIKAMSTVNVSDKQLVAYEILAQGFSSEEIRKIRRALSSKQSETLRYIDYNNELQRIKPPMTLFYLRYSNKVTNLADQLYDIFSDLKLQVQEPLVSPGQTDIVFIKK